MDSPTSEGEKTADLECVTIPQLFRRSVSRHGPKDALVFRETGERKSYYELDRAIDAFASGLLAVGLEKGDRVGIWSPNRYEWVLTSVRNRPDRSDPGERQSRIPDRGIGIRAQQGWLQGARPDSVVQVVRLSFDDPGLGPGTGVLRARPAERRKAADSRKRYRDRRGARAPARSPSTRSVISATQRSSCASRTSTVRSARTMPSTSSSPLAPRVRLRGRRSLTTTSSTTRVS